MIRLLLKQCAFVCLLAISASATGSTEVFTDIILCHGTRSLWSISYNQIPSGALDSK